MMKRELIGVLDNVRSRYNVGAIFRTADGLGVTKLYLCGITPKPDREEDRIGITKTALGAEETVPWEGAAETVDLIRRLKSEGFSVIALETDVSGIPLPDLISSPSFKKRGQGRFERIALLVGHEVFGIRRNVLDEADIITEIPMSGTKRSLNVEVSFAIGTYALMKSP